MAPGLQEAQVVTNDLSAVGRLFNGGTMHVNNVSRDDNNITFRNYSDVGNMSLAARKSLEIIGVTLADERTVGKNVSGADNRSVVLGTVCVESTKITLEELRRLMCTEIPCLPASFNFLSKEGWPVHRQQEHKIKASHVISDNNCICIKKEFEKSRIGVVTSGGDPVGFVFADLNATVRQLREIIEQQLKISQQLRLEYRFVERNGWPVMSSQEPSLSLVDIMLGQVVRIQSSERFYPDLPVEPTRPTSTISVASHGDSKLQNVPDSAEHAIVKRIKSLKFRPDQSSVKTRKDSDKRLRAIKDDFMKPILISYVRAEAVQYALDLKQELVKTGYNVYLDVHEIKTGSDWQDALNFAVTNCFMFVPLITPGYGMTQWTNREIKLADVLGKIIIPVNFMENWPPPCLAIQFASTQYIPWKLPDTDHVKGEVEKPCDHRVWDKVCVKRCAKQVADSYKEHCSKLPRRHPSGKEMAPQVNKPLLSAREDYYMLQKDDYAEDSKQIIVITAHPRQRYVAQDLKSTFEKSGHEVWCSVDLLEIQENMCSDETALTNPNTPRNLPTIQEGGVFFSQNDAEMLNSLGDKRSVSMYKESEAYGRRPLSRLMSQFSDISQPSTLSQDKLNHLKTFQQKVDQAAVVIVLVSEAYTKSTFSHQQVFYCEHRKRVVLVRCDAAPVPKWFRLLMGNDMIMKNDPKFDIALEARVKRAFNPTSSETPKDATSEAKMNYLVNFLKRNLPLQDMCVYVAGSSKLMTQRAEDICRAIGTELAKVERISLVTGGFFGAADITAKTFCESRDSCCRFNSEDSAVVHILPMHDSENLTAKARQNPDGSFEAVPYGKTVFLGDSVKERETVVARLLDTCIVIEGGPGVVHEVEEFIWNDHFVIPIMSTGGAAGGQYGVPVKIFELPPGVDVADWSVLSEKDAMPEAVAKAVVNIMVSLKKALASPTSTLKATVITKRKSRKKLKSRKLRVQEQDNDMHELDITPSSNASHHMTTPTMRSSFEILEPSEISQSSSDERNIFKKRRNWWQKFLSVFRHRS